MANHHWRDCKAWMDFGTPMSTTSNEACKLYDAALTQFVGRYDDQTLGGLESCIHKIIEEDPNFVMGHVIKNGLTAISTSKSTRKDKVFEQDVFNMVNLCKSSCLSQREKNHVLAVKLWTEGNISKAVNIWEDILCNNPLDMLAIKFTEFSHFFLGHKCQMRDSVARVLPYWNSSMPLYGYLYGIYAFGLCETNMFDCAERNARKALEINRKDGWATHSMAHVYEMKGCYKEGLQFMYNTENDWSDCIRMAGHNYWHWSLFHIEQNNLEDAVGLFDTQISHQIQSDNINAMVDTCSLLYRLELEGLNVKDRWESLLEVYRSHVSDNILVFNDVHLMMACLGCDDTDASENLLNSMKEHLVDGAYKEISKEIGVPLCEALVAYDSGDFDRAVELLYPIRYDIGKIGGSNAQLDIFNLFLVHAAVKSSKLQNQKRARLLLMERKAMKENSLMTDRIMRKLFILHREG